MIGKSTTSVQGMYDLAHSRTHTAMEKSSQTTPPLTAGITIESISSTASIRKPSITATDVLVVRKSEYKAAALCLAEAFVADDVARYFIDTPDRAHWSEAEKWDLHLSIMEYLVLAHCMKGLVTTVGPNYDCVALWYARRSPSPPRPT